MHFLGWKIYFSSLKFFSHLGIVHLVLMEGGGGISYSYAFLGIWEAILGVETYFLFVWNLISVYVYRYQIIFLFEQPGACSRSSSLTIFSAFTSNSGSGRPGAGPRLSKLKTDFISAKYILWGSTQNIRSLLPKNGFTDP